MPGQTLLDRYAMPCTLVIAACSLVLAVVFRIEMYLRMEQPYLPMVANIMCVVFFVTGSMQQLHQQWETMVRRGARKGRGSKVKCGRVKRQPLGCGQMWQGHSLVPRPFFLDVTLFSVAWVGP